MVERDRERVERELASVVRANRFTIAVVFPLMGAVLLVASAEAVLPDPVSYNPYLILFGTMVMRLPLIAGVLPLVDRRATVLLAVLTLYAYGIELLGVTTGWPYGAFEYTIDLGPMLFGAVPVGLPVFFFPLVLNSYLLALLLLGPRAGSAAVRLASTLAIVVGVDLVLDPAAVAVGFWAYDAGGAYYGVPWSNYAGWLLSGAVAVLVFDRAFARTDLLTRLEECEFMLDDLVSFIVLWGAINAFYGNWVPVALSALLAGGLVRSDRFDFDVLRRWSVARR